MNTRRIPAALTAIGLALTLVACGAAASPGSGGAGGPGTPPAETTSAGGGDQASTSPGGGSVPSPDASATGPVTGHLGQDVTFPEYGGFDEADGTVVKVFDPAVPVDASEAPLPTATHWVGVEATIDNHSADFQSEGSTFDAVTSAGTTVTINDTYQGGSYTLGDGFQGCTQQVSGSQQPYTYCLAFPVPDGQTLTQVGVKVGGAEVGMGLVPTDQAVWLIP